VGLKEGQKVELHKAAGQMNLQCPRLMCGALFKCFQGFNQFHGFWWLKVNIHRPNSRAEINPEVYMQGK
jgi:hypothetical protein